MNIRKEFEAWFLREHGDGNFGRLESGECAGEYADLAVRNHWGIWQGAWAVFVEQSPAVPGCVMETSKQEALAIIRDIKSWDCDPERGLLSLPLELRQRMQAALESTQPAEQQPAPAVSALRRLIGCCNRLAAEADGAARGLSAEVALSDYWIGYLRDAVNEAMKAVEPEPEGQQS